MRYVGVAAAMTVILILAAGAESDEISELKERLAIVEDRLERLEAYRVADKYVCTDEYEQAIAYSTPRRGTWKISVPALWDGAPFVVDISSTFPNAGELLDVIEDEAERIRGFLGYEIFVAGDVLPLADLTKAQLASVTQASQFIPPNQHIEIRCCYGEGISSAGAAAASLRMILLENDDFQSRHIIMHELYHLLGFTHPGDSSGVVMSDSLMFGPGLTPFGAVIPTQPSPFDLARLSCIYPATVESFDQLPTPTHGAYEAPCEKNGTGEVTLYSTATIGGYVPVRMSVYIDDRWVGSLSSAIFSRPDCGAPSEAGSWITETVTAGIPHTVSATSETAQDVTTWEAEVDIGVCECAWLSFD